MWLISIICEHILLVDPIVRAVSFKWISMRIFISQNPVDPDIPWESIQLMKPEQSDTTGYFVSDSVQR